MAAMGDEELARIIGSTKLLTRIPNFDVQIIPTKDIILRKKIGEGGFGAALLGNYRGRDCIVKSNKKSEGMIPYDFIKEVSLLKLFNQFPETKSVRMIGLLYNKSAPVPLYNIVLEKLDEDLFSVVSKRDISDITQIKILFYKLISVFLAIHQLGFIHSDIKIENIMLKGDDIRIIDFGLARFIGLRPSLRIMSSLYGTLATMAPDAPTVRDYDPDNRNSFASDVYSLGVVFLHILIRTVDKLTISESSVLDKRGIDRLGIVLMKIGDIGFDLITKMTNKKAKERITLEDALNHPFFEGITKEMNLDRRYFGGNMNEYLLTKTLNKNNIEYSQEDYDRKAYELKYLEQLNGNYKYLMVPKVKIEKSDAGVFITLILFYLRKVLGEKYEVIGIRQSTSFNVLLNTILNVKYYLQAILTDAKKLYLSHRNPDLFYEYMLLDTYLINNFNTTIYNHGYLNRTILLENIMGQTGGFDYSIETRSFQLFLGMFNKELYPIWIQMVDIETRLKFEIKDPRLDRLLEEILAKSCLNMIVFSMNTNEIPIDISFWELSIFCYLRYIVKVLGITIDELLEKPIVDWLVIEKEKYIMLEGYLMSGFEEMKERGREFIDTIDEIFGEF